MRGICFKEDGSVAYEGTDEKQFVEKTGLWEWFHTVNELALPDEAVRSLIRLREAERNVSH